MKAKKNIAEGIPAGKELLTLERKVMAREPFKDNSEAGQRNASTKDYSLEFLLVISPPTRHNYSTGNGARRHDGTTKKERKTSISN